MFLVYHRFHVCKTSNYAKQDQICKLLPKYAHQEPPAMKTTICGDDNAMLKIAICDDTTEERELVELYARRVNHYCRFAVTALPDVRNTKSMTVRQQRTAEGEAILRQLADGDYVTLLDERGEEYRSVEFALWLQKRMNSGVKRLVMVIGGPYGFSDEVYRRADAKLSLSRMTFSHQIVRAIFAEQIYRAFTILNNEPYHHE